jgi:hypothetical protein
MGQVYGMAYGWQLCGLNCVNWLTLIVEPAGVGDAKWLSGAVLLSAATDLRWAGLPELVWLEVV